MQENVDDIFDIIENMEYLYHYTNLEALASIIKNHTIRFTSLDQMDDLQEKESADIRNAGQFCYISSWTEDEEESIPMWNLYATMDSGVRIKLRKKPFKVMNIVNMIQNGYVSPQAMTGSILYPVEYTVDNDKLYPKLLAEDKEQFSISLGLLGKYKNVHWNFQKEWRYLLHIIPWNINQTPQKSVDEFKIVANMIREGTAKQVFPYYDMEIEDSAYNEMEIVMSPRFSSGNRILVECLLEKYNSNAIVTDSILKDLI